MRPLALRWLAGAITWFMLGTALARGPVPPPPPPPPPPAPCPERPIQVAFYVTGVLYDLGPDEGASGFTGKGIDVDLLRELKRRSGCRFEGATMTRARIWAEMEGGRLDMTPSGIATPERSKIYAFAPYLLLRHTVWMLKAHAPVASLADFMADPKMRWGAVRGYKHTPAFDATLDQARALGRVVEATDDNHLLRLLAEGSVDAVICQSFVIHHLAGEHPRKPQLVSLDWAPQGSVVPAGLLLARAHFNEVEQAYWRGLVREMVRDGTVARIMRRHVSEEDAADMLPKD